MRLSVVSTLYRSAPHLAAFHARVAIAADRVSDCVEFIYVNDGSPDDDLTVALELQASDPRIRIVDLSRNFGHHPAMMTGLQHATGERIFLIDCDLEEPPELVNAFTDELARTDADVVYGVQASRTGGAFDRFCGQSFYTIFNALSPDPIPANLMTVRLMSRRYVDALLLHPEVEFVIAGLWARTGFKQVPMPVNKGRKPTSTYDLRRKMEMLVNAVTGFSAMPLRMIFYLGLAISSLAGFAAVSLLSAWVIRGGEFQAGWPSLIVSVWLLGGLTIFCQGVIGIYLGKVYTEAKRRPATIIRQIYEPQIGGGHAYQRTG